MFGERFFHETSNQVIDKFHTHLVVEKLLMNLNTQHFDKNPTLQVIKPEVKEAV